jgi:hypothetical protein
MRDVNIAVGTSVIGLNDIFDSFSMCDLLITLLGCGRTIVAIGLLELKKVKITSLKLLPFF